MKVRSLLVGTTVLAAVALAPNQARAQNPCGSLTYSFVNPGLGGFLSGCFQFTLSELGENAGGIGSQYFWTNGGALLGTGAPNNAASLGAGTFFFTDDCGSDGTPGFANFMFCDGSNGAHPLRNFGPALNPTGELVLGMLVHDLVTPPQNGGADYWLYSGTAARNAYPAPPGFQEVLYQLTTGGVPQDGQFLFAWEDINSACLAVAGSALHPSLTTFRTEDLGNKQILDDPNNCSVFSGTSASDNDFNDSYIRLSIAGTRLDTVTPEPMTMTLMATGLVGLAGASLRRRNRKKN